MNKVCRKIVVSWAGQKNISSRYDKDISHVSKCRDPGLTAPDYHFYLTDRMQCSAHKEQEDTDPEACMPLGFGDSGGPLVCPSNTFGGNWTVIGAVSWGDFCDANHYTPSVYGRVQAMRDWVINTMTDNM